MAIMQSADNRIRRLRQEPVRLASTFIEKFVPHFAPGAKALCFSNTTLSSTNTDGATLQRVGLPLERLAQFPDIVLYAPRRRLLYLIEVAGSHGYVTDGRRSELERLAKRSKTRRVYVSAFSDRKQFVPHVDAIAWETEVWFADEPGHLIHYNGKKFLGPYKPI